MNPTRSRPFAQIAIAAAALLLATLPLYAAPIALNPRNASDVDEAYLRSVLTGTERFWEDGHEVLIAVLRDDPDAEEALSRYSGMTPSKFKNHWQRIAFSGRGKMPKQFDNLDDLIEFVNRNPGAIAIVGNHKADTLKPLKL